MVYLNVQIDLNFIILIQSNMKGKRICSYHITNHLLGSGSFSQVYLGYSATQEKVAVKIIPRDKIKDNDLQIFESQITLLNNCKNEYIINFIDVKKTKTNFYIFLEHCQGGNLSQYIARCKRLSEKQALGIFSQLVKGMNAMKKINVMHRDLKSANIMFKGKNIKIVDFGLARKYSKGEMLKTYAGTPFNMAPEILRGQLYNEKADVYSAGTILYEMLFGCLPFEDKSIPGMLKKIDSAFKSSQPLPHLQKNPHISLEIQQLLIKMLQPNPQKRIDFDGVMIELRRMEQSNISQRVRQYKRLSAAALPYMAMLGGFAGMFGFNGNVDNGKNKQSVYDMDLRICGRLSRKLIEKQLEWLENIDMIRV